MGLMAQEKNFM